MGMTLALVAAGCGDDDDATVDTSAVTDAAGATTPDGTQAPVDTDSAGPDRRARIDGRVERSARID